MWGQVGRIVLNYMNNSVQNIRMTSLPVNESFIQKSIIAQLPESHYQQESVTQMQTQIGRLRQELHYYKKQASFKSKPQSFSFRDIDKPTGTQQVGEAGLRQENQQQKLIIKKLSQELRSKKKSGQGVDLAAECQRLQHINKKLENENCRIQSENQQLKKQLSQIMDKNNDEVKSKVSEQVDEIKRRNMQLEQKVSQLTEAAMQYTKEIDALSIQIQKLRRENVIDRSARQSPDNLRVHNGNSRYSIINMHTSRALSELELLDTERFNLKISEKNKEYEQLYLKYQSLQNEFHAVQEINNDLERQRKFLAERLSDIEIHTQGDEIVGELQNKLVLMSTELMRLGNLSRTKTQQSKELSLKVKELILKRQNLEKDVIQRDKLILNYKQEVRLIEIRNNQRVLMESRAEKDTHMRQKNTKLMKQVERLGILIKQKGEALKDSDIRNAILQQKNTRLQKQNEQLQKENKDFIVKQEENKKIHTKVLNLQAQVNYFKEANSALKGEMKRYESKLYENRSDIDKMGREREETRNVNQDLQDKVRTMQEELRRTQLQLQEKNMELRQINHKSEEKVILKSNQIKRLQEKVLILQKEAQRGSRTRGDIPRYEQLVKEIQRLEGLQLTLKLQIDTYQEKIVLLAQQNERLHLLVKNNKQQKSNVDRLRLENEQKERKIRDLNKQVESLDSRQKRQKEQNQNLRERLRGTMVQQRQSEGLQFKNRQLRDQIDALRTQLSVKEQQARNLNERYRKQSSERYTLLLRNEELTSRVALNKAENYGNEPNKDYYQNELKALNNQLRAKNEKLIKLEQELGESEQTYNTFSAEIQRLNLVLQKRTREVIIFKKEIEFLQHKVHTCEESLRQRNNIQIASEKSIAEAESKSKIELCEGKIRNFEGELQLMRQRYENLKREYSALQSKLGQTMNQKNIFQQRTSQLQYQLNERSSNFRNVQDSFKLTIFQIKNSNQRLEQAMGQIQNHYIDKLQKKQRECQQIRAQRKTIENQFHELQRKVANIQSEHGSEIKQKNLFINSLSSNHNQTKQEIAQIRRIKGEYQVKITLLSQQIERMTQLKERQRIEIDRLKQQIDTSQNRFTSSMRESTANTQTIDVLSAQIQRLNNVLVQNAQKMRDNTKRTAKLQSQCLQLTKDYESARQKILQYERILSDERENSSDRIRKLDELNKQLKYQLQEKTKDADRFLERIQTLQKRQQAETSEYMRTMSEQMKLLRQGNFKLQQKLGVITREYQQLVTQLQHYKRPKSNQGDEKMRIIGNYQATIKHMREENSILDAQRHKLKIQNDRILRISHEIQQRGKISQEKVRVFEQKCKRLDERCRVLQDRARNTDQTAKVVNMDRLQVEQKMFSALEEVSRLQTIIKTKDVDIDKLQALLASESSQTQQYYQKIRDKRGIFVIKQASEVDERSRSASGNGPQPQLRYPPSPHGDLQHRYQLLESVNKKLSAERQCLRTKVSQYEYKMKKLKQEFDLINRLIHEYREENDKLKQANKALIAQGQRGNNFMPSHSQFSSAQHSSVKGSSYIDHSQRLLSPPVPSRSNIQPNRQQNIQIKTKLGEEIDRLTKVNHSLQSEIHDLRVNSTDNVALRRRLDETLALVVILFAQIQSLRMRVRDSQGRRQVGSPVKN